MSQLAQRLLRHNYAEALHPYRIFEQQIDRLLGASDTLLDAGCGRKLPVLRKYLGRAQRLIGVDLVDFADVPPGICVCNADLSGLPLADASVDLIISRSVFEHLADPDSVYREFRRVLRPGGRLVFLTPNLWDYASLLARLIPNRFHARIVKAVEGREEEDTFPVAYRTNSRSQIIRLAAQSGMVVESFAYLGQYPNYLMFNGALFFLGMHYEKLLRRHEALAFLRGWLLVTLRKPATD